MLGVGEVSNMACASVFVHVAGASRGGDTLAGLNGGLGREMDRMAAAADFGLSSQKISLLREKKEDIERVSVIITLGSWHHISE